MTTLKSEGSAESSPFTSEVLHRLTECGRMIKLDELEGLNVLVILSQNPCLQNMAELNGEADPVFFQQQTSHLLCTEGDLFCFCYAYRILNYLYCAQFTESYSGKMDPWL